MGSVLGLISIIGFMGSIVWLIVRLFKRSGRKKPLIGVGICLVLFIVALNITPPTPSPSSMPSDIESISKPISGESSSTNEPPTIIDNETEVTSEMEGKLIMMSEDIIKDTLSHPATAKFHTMLWTFNRRGTVFNVGGKVTAENGFGVKEDIEFQISYEAYDDYKKIKPTAVYLNGVKVSK